MPYKHMFTYKGERLETKELASALGISAEALRKRLKTGWVYKNNMLVCPKRKQREVKDPVVVGKSYDLKGGFTYDLGECGLVI